eukprot:CAMPEP_0184539856 /NCGR_PEP_ID=MMETSP0198_2-20121128/18345_1 /TAXON_ID=1112570 /ORGANISM="Thraustochytrium sp., Strain LLF1b" /LENGTH=193 /DNA_ID=CAMNT_0026933391 /DNA_START=190 /DNA_END=768 /DNA_ORIENTATION=-
MKGQRNVRETNVKHTADILPCVLDYAKHTYGQVESIYCGKHYSVAKTCSGRLLSWGWGPFGELGRDSAQFSSGVGPVRFNLGDQGMGGEPEVVSVACGDHHVAAFPEAENYGIGVVLSLNQKAAVSKASEMSLATHGSPFLTTRKGPQEPKVADAIALNLRTEEKIITRWEKEILPQWKVAVAQPKTRRLWSR